ncbi:hypothetical protein NHX12_002525 [Muraenolepis orangiensis]|uniref:Kielin/chordin-like protein n=1 Tax=Muraenolepis orangiensis TaxID=630683 RepID=A0A9Q0DYM4_9TELE|nr:hypothetical protein NHX12_002525 [Muraenolepis orangiensis]
MLPAMHSCGRCDFESKVYLDGQDVPSRADPCLRCRCSAGEVSCERLDAVCPALPCSHPAKPRGQCCPGCDQCEYDSRIYADGQRFQPPGSGPCLQCRCKSGTVECLRRPCPLLNCTNPHTAPGECCPKCPGCSFENHVFVDGEAVPSPASVCERCVCMDGRVDCRSPQCPPPNCNAPTTGTCCNNNCHGCGFAGKEYPNGQDFPHPTNKCRTCTCLNGNVQCLLKRCPPLQCSDPTLLPGECCPQCPAPPAGCVYEQRRYRHTERFYHPTDTCRSCLCTNGTVQCQRKPCPSAPCSHPITQDCCPTCEGCLQERRERANGETWAQVSDPCGVCTCHDGSVRCEKNRCPPANCRYPVQRKCCLACDGCLFQGQEYPDGYEFVEEKDRCSVCSCYSGDIVCSRLPCYADCRHPYTPTGQCCGECDPLDGCACPVCNGCRFTGRDCFNGERFTHPTDRCQLCSCQHEGREHQSGSAFTPSRDPCSSCTCLNEVVSCQRRPCPVQCSHPVPSESCCPACDSCLHQGLVHADGDTFSPASNPCRRCTCVRGAVTCTPLVCPPAPCGQPVTRPGQCCPQCTGCMYDGEEHADGSSWFADATDCMSCMCVAGVTTCSEIRCLSPCVNTVRVPGECCPVCADCLFEGRVYSPSDSFHPADDPCQICTCEVMPDGQQHLWCYRKQCPSLVDCPVNNILFSGPDTCCPVCARHEQLTLPDSCCPVCEECVIEGQRARVPSGSSWTDSDDDCVTCTCNLGHIECSIEECLHLVCHDGQIPMKTPGKCCYECQGALYQPSEQWAVDECTSCTCVSGDTEMPAVVPGVCCPHCLPRPATCIAFGDPHYRTFDGRMLHFQGACTYVLAQDCEAGHFSIHVTNDDRGRKRVSWTKEVTVFIGDLSVNDKVVALPFLREPFIYVERQTNTILLNTNIGIKVLWSGRSHLEVSVPGSYRKHTCGLCGDFNNYPQDDLRMPNGQIGLSEASFGNSWQVVNRSHALSSCRHGEDVDPCKEAGYQARKGANGRCKVLKSAAFKPCHRVVPPEPWHGACVYDLCACGANTDECLCDTLEAYASQCREAGVVLQWRTVGCPVERGFVFDECGPPCPVTCLNADVPLGVLESHCFKPCVPGCQCPAGLVLHNNYCIPPDKCPKIIHDNSSALHGSLWVTEGVHSIMARQWHTPELEVRGHALGCLTLADLLSLLEVKYEVITGMLYTEMLLQHYGLSVWETLLPWQQDKEKEGLEDLARLALGSGDLIRLSELPGAFRIYKTCEQFLFLTGSSGSSVQSSWSAVTALTEVYASRQQERDSLTHLSKRLDRESLKLLFLHIRLATFRAQTEHRYYGALLAARQLWESWPCINDTLRQETVAWWLHGDEEEKEKEIFISASPQQAVLQWLVLKQKAERKYLLGLLHGVSLDQLQGQESCGAALEELPYLEILCVSDTATTSHNGRPTAEQSECSVKVTVDPTPDRVSHMEVQVEPELVGPELQEFDFPEKETAMQAKRESGECNKMKEPVSWMEREKTMRNLVDVQRKVEMKQQRDRERQLLREDKIQQKTVVRARLEQLRRERSCVMQSKRDRNTAGFKELLGPVVHSTDTENSTE